MMSIICTKLSEDIMKKSLAHRLLAALLLISLLIGSLASCAAPCIHTDGDCDGKCDECADGMAILHSDLDYDYICDRCGAELTEPPSPEPCIHADGDCDGKCDGCADGMAIQHSDLDHDYICDRCGAELAKPPCSEHTDIECDGECDRCGEKIKIQHEDEEDDGVCDKCDTCIGEHTNENNDTKCDKCGAAVLPASLTAKKTASHSAGKTLYPAHRIEWSNTTYRGATVTYTITVTNTGDTPTLLTVTDTVKPGTSLLSGCDEAKGDSLSWVVSLEGGEEKAISYTVEVVSTEAGVISGGGAMIFGAEIAADDLYIAPTFNELDEEYIDKAIRILLSSTYTGLDFAKHAYTVAFTNPKAITTLLTGTPADALTSIASGGAVSAMVAPGLYGGTELTGEISAIMGNMKAAITKGDLVAGDLILTRVGGECFIYIVGDGAIYNITGVAEVADATSLLCGLSMTEAYAVLRPSLTMTAFTPSDPDEVPEALNGYQEAIVKTAEAYLLRGEKLQYDDTRFGLTGSSSSNTSGEFRWQIDIKAPEDYTTTEWGYLNCAAFTYEVYRTALGYTLPNEMYTTYNLSKYSESLGMRVFRFTNDTPGEYTEEYKLEVERELMTTLEAGDILVVRRQNGSGHAMLYIGDGRLIHSGGGSYSVTGGVGYEVYEPTIRCHKVADYVFDDTSVGGNPFRGSDGYGENYVTELLLVRPLNAFNGEIPEITRTRVEKMQDIMVEKTSSHPSATTVNVDDTITYYFTVTNFGKTERELDISDKAPVGTTYTGGAERVNDGVLGWSITVAAGESAVVSYTVRVNEDAEGTLIYGTDATVGGVPVKCPGIYVRRTLTEAEKEAIIAAVEELRTEGTSLTELALVNEIYKRALGIDNDIFLTTDADEVMTGEGGVFVTSSHKIGSKAATEINPDTSAYYRSMLAEGLYGGYRVYSGQLKNDRTRLLGDQNLVVGDILIGRTSSAIRVFIYLGDSTFVQLHGTTELPEASSFSTICENIMYFGRDFAVLRPSHTLGDIN